MRPPARALSILVALALAACSGAEPTAPTPDASLAPAPSLAKVADEPNVLDDLNVALADEGQDVRVAMMEYITAPGSGEFGTTVFARNVGNKQLAYHWAPNLVMLPGALTWAVDETEGSAAGGLTPAQTSASIDAAMATWEGQTCSELNLFKVPVPPIDLGVVQYLLGFGGFPGRAAELTHAGWLPPAFFDAIAVDGSQYILGATFTFIWTSGGVPVDSDGDGKIDVAFREIYYNNNFAWADTPEPWYSPFVDAETIALHEAGHGLSQAHFGKVFFDGKGDGSLQHLHFAPRAVMNATYWDSQRELLGSDVGGHCSIWGSWPN